MTEACAEQDVRSRNFLSQVQSARRCNTRNPRIVEGPLRSNEDHESKVLCKVTRGEFSPSVNSTAPLLLVLIESSKGSRVGQIQEIPAIGNGH